MRVLDFSFTEKKVHILLKSVTESAPCTLCGKAIKKVRCYTSRSVRDMDILGRKTYLEIESRQFECSGCKRYFTEDIEIVVGNHGLTKRYESYLYKQIKGVNIQQICEKEDVCWATLNAIHKAHGAVGLAHRAVARGKVRRLSIDEISVRKGKENYACVLRDADSNVVLDMLEKRGMATLKAYFLKKGAAFCGQIQEVVSDMRDGYVNLAGAKGIFINAVNVIDLFHFVQHLGTALDGGRKEARKASPEEEALKGLRWILLKAPENIDKEEQEKLKSAFNIAKKLEGSMTCASSLGQFLKLIAPKKWGLPLSVRGRIKHGKTCQNRLLNS